MPARVPLDVDLEDKLLYGLTPIRLVYLVVSLLVSFGACGPSMLWRATPEVAQLLTQPLGFDAAPEADRMRWLNGFRRLLDELDSPLQVVIQTEPGSGGEPLDGEPRPRDFDEMRS